MSTSASEPPIDVSKLNFQEFHAVRNRRRAQEDKNEPNERSKVSSKDYIPIQRTTRHVSGQFIELFQVQMFIIVLIFLDVLCVAIQFYIEERQLAETNPILAIFVRLLDSFTGFTLFFFIMELGVSIFSFQLLFFAHLGYLLDFSIILMALYWELQFQSQGTWLGYDTCRMINDGCL